MYFKEFEIRWNDLDANRHLANSSYMAFMSHTRMSFLAGLGIDHQTLADHHLGPVVFYEHIYYFREVLPGGRIKVSLKLAGLSEDSSFFKFHHDFYDQGGKHLAHCEIMGSWIDLQSRKLSPLPIEIQKKFDKAERPDNFQVLTREDTRKNAMRPKDLEQGAG